MHLVYLDEVKYQEGIEPFHWLCGLAFPEQSILPVEERLRELALNYFSSSNLVRDTEFHAKEIVHGKGPYKGKEMAGRTQLFCALIDIIDECEDLKRIAVRIDPAKMVTTGHEEKALMFFVEKVESLMRAKKSVAMLIADHDKDLVSTNVASLSAYKARGTSCQFGIEIKNIVDTIHHTKSHHSRLIQLADIYTYTMALYPKGESKYPQSKIMEHTRTKQNFGSPSKYKYWPTEDSWYVR